jgi:hypothetical protein
LTLVSWHRRRERWGEPVPAEEPYRVPALWVPHFRISKHVSKHVGHCLVDILNQYRNAVFNTDCDGRGSLVKLSNVVLAGVLSSSLLAAEGAAAGPCSVSDAKRAEIQDLIDDNYFCRCNDN